MRWLFLLFFFNTAVYAQQAVFLDDNSDADDIRQAWQLNNASASDKKYRSITKHRDPAWYLRDDENLQQAPRTAAKIHFALNSATILPNSHAILAEHAKVLQERPNAIVVIAGHTDNSGHDLYNLGLSYQRAEAVQQFLIQQHNIPATQLRVKPYGERQPLANNDTEAGRALNRRVEFLYLGEM